MPRSAGLTVGETAGAEDDALPFAPELGVAVTWRDGFAAPLLLPGAQGVRAAVALVGGAGGEKLVDLRDVHGDVAPPRLAPAGDALVIAIPGSDAGGGTLSLARLDAAGVSFGGSDVPTGRDASVAFDVVVQGARGLVVWDEYSKREGRGSIRGASFGVASLERGEAVMLSPSDHDATTPRLAPRPGGYWLAWIAHGKLHSEAGRPATSDPEADNPLLDETPRWVSVQPIDAAGASAGDAHAVTPTDGRVLSFDVAPRPGGGLWAAWRNDAARPGLDTARVQLARVGADGSVEREVVEHDDLGAGAPSLLVDATPSRASPRTASPRAASPRTWLALSSRSDAPHLRAVDGPGESSGVWVDTRALRGADVLAASGGRLLLARARGRGIELGVAACRGD